MFSNLTFITSKINRTFGDRFFWDRTCLTLPSNMLTFSSVVIVDFFWPAGAGARGAGVFDRDFAALGTDFIPMSCQ